MQRKSYKITKDDFVPKYRLKRIKGKYKGCTKLKEDTSVYDYIYYSKEKDLRKNSKRITKGLGIYGIFVRDKRYKNQLGKCLYIGQSRDVKRRVKEHKDSIKHAERVLQGYRSHTKNFSISWIKDNDIEFKYYRIADKYSLKNIKFVKIMSFCGIIDSCNTLTYAEQHCIDEFRPLYNTVVAKPTENRKK